MKRFLTTLLILTTMTFLGTSCGNEENIATENATTNETSEPKGTDTPTATSEIKIVDSIGEEIVFEAAPKNVITLGSSLTEVWLLAGGDLVGTSSDAFEREIGLEGDEVDVGSYTEPNVEQILKLNPDLVVMSSNISGQRDIEQVLRDANIKVMFSDINSFDEYLTVLQNFTTINNTPELYETNGVTVQNQIDEAVIKASELEPKTGLILRTSTAMLKALPSDNFSVQIMEDMGISNIANSNTSILDDISIEAILKEDPYYIFLVIMGSDEEASMEKINQYIAENPAWETLSAVKKGRFIVLPKDLFHYKPNNRWGEAYEYIYDIRATQE